MASTLLKFKPRKLTSALAYLKRNNYFTYSNQLSQPLDKEPTVCKTALEAVECVKSGEKIHKIICRV